MHALDKHHPKEHADTDKLTTELSNMPLGEGVQHIVGAIGVQP